MGYLLMFIINNLITSKLSMKKLDYCRIVLKSVILILILNSIFIGTSFASTDDIDNDGLNNTEEYWWATDPNNPDSDGDGAYDGDEVARVLSGDRSFGTPFFKNNVWNSLSVDGDHDGVPDLAETYAIGISPDRLSTDGDKYDDGQELFGISPNGVLPGYVTSPGDRVFVAAYPEIDIDISDSISLVNIEEITFEERASEVTTQGYSVSNTEGSMTSMGSSETHTESDWIDVSNKEADSTTQTNYQEGITNTEANYFKGYTEGKTTELETSSSLTSTVGAKVGAGYSLTGPSVSAEVSTEISSELAASMKNAIETSSTTNEYHGISTSMKTGGETVNTRVRETEVSSGSREESSYSTSITRTEYHETTVTNSNSIATGTEWATATTTNTGHAADLIFTYFIENKGTDIALEVDDIVFSIFIGDEEVPITYYASQDMGSPINNLKPSQTIQFSNTQGTIPLSLQQLRKIDEGAPIRIVLASYSYGVDELSYENAWGNGVLFEIDDGISDGDETIDMYMVPIWGESKYANIMGRAVPVTIGNGALTSINNQPITEWSWWDIMLQNPTLETKFMNEMCYPKTRVFLRYNLDSDHDYYSDRTEQEIGTDPANRESHPDPIISAGAYYENDGENTTIKLKLTNSGNFDAYGIEARLISPDDSTTVLKEIVGGGGRLVPGQEIILEEDVFVFKNNSADYEEPIILVSYNEPQGHHCIIPVKIDSVEENVSQYSARMGAEPKVIIEASSRYTYDSPNVNIIHYNNPTDTTIENVHIYITYQSLSGDLFNSENLIVDLYPGNNSFFDWWIPSDDLSSDMIGETVKVIAVVADYQNILIDEDVHKMDIVDYGFEEPEMVVSPDSWDFSTVEQGDLLLKDFRIFNQGFAPLKFVIQSTANISLVDVPLLADNLTPAIIVMPGSSIDFKAKVSTINSGTIADEIVVYCNDLQNPDFRIGIYGNVNLSSAYSNNIRVIDYKDGIWWKKIHIIGNYAEGTELVFNHSIVTDPETVFPVAVYDLAGNELGVGKKINDSGYLLEKSTSDNWSINFHIPENIVSEEYYFINFGKEIVCTNPNFTNSITVNVSDTGLRKSQLILLGEYGRGSNTDILLNYSEKRPFSQALFWSTPTEIYCELLQNYYSPEKTFVWDPYLLHSIPKYANITITNGRWYRNNLDPVHTICRDTYGTFQILDCIEFQFRAHSGLWNIAKSYTINSWEGYYNNPEWDVILPKTFFSPQVPNQIRIRLINSQEREIFWLKSEWVVHNISVSYNYSYGSVSPNLSVNGYDLWSHSGIFNSSHSISNLENIFVIGTNEVSASSDEIGAIKVFFARVDYSPDLEILSQNIQIPLNYVVEGDIVTLKANISNLNDNNISNFIVSFYDGNPSTNGHLIGNDVVTDTLSGNDSIVAECIWDTSANEGTHEIFVKVDPYNEISETNESNNVAYRTFTVNAKPDLAINEITFSSEKPTDGYLIDISAVIENQGGNASYFNISFYDGTPDIGSLIGKNTVVSLNAESNTTISVPWIPTAGYHDIYVFVDEDDQIIESDKSNNVKNRTIFISIDEIYIDNGNSSSDIPYSGFEGYGCLDGIIYNGWGTEPQNSTRYDMDGEILYRFDNLDPKKDYHLDIEFSEKDLRNRVEEVWIDNVYTETSIFIDAEPRWISVTVPAGTYDDNSIVVSIKRSGPGDAIVNEMRLQEIENVYIDCGAQSDTEYGSSSEYGYLSGIPFTSWGYEPYKTVRYTMDEDIVYRFDTLDISKDYQFDIVFYEADNLGRIEGVWIDNVKMGDDIDLSDGAQHHIIMDVPNSLYYQDGSVELHIRATNIANTVVSEITLEENTVRKFNSWLFEDESPGITITAPSENSIFNSSSITISYEITGDSEDVGSVYLKLDSEDVITNDVTETAGSHLFSELDEGSHSVNIWLVNSTGDQFAHPDAHDTVNFTVDTIPPELLLDPVITPTNNSSQLISGSFVETGTGIDSITVNGVHAFIYGTTYSHYLELSEEENIVKIEAVDKAGNKNSITTSVYLESIPQEKISVESTISPRNSTVIIPINVENIENVSGISFDFCYDPGVAKVDNVSASSFSESFATVTANMDNTNGVTRVVLTFSNTISVPTEFILVNLTVNVTGDFGSSTSLNLQNVEFSDIDFVPYTPDVIINGNLQVGIKGDLNNNGRVDIGDVSKVAFMVAGKVPEDLNADFNNNGRVDVGDAAKIAFYLAGKVSEL